jgi:hypothetical protein
VALPDIVRSVALGFVALPLIACGSDVLAPDVEQVHLTLTLSQTEMVVGDTVEIRVVGTNPTRNTLRFTTGDCAVFHIRMRWGADLVVFRHPTVCNDIALERVIEPGDSIVETTLFDGTVAPPGPFLDANGEEPTLTLAPGRYTVVATPPGAAGNESNTVELRIRP